MAQYHSRLSDESGQDSSNTATHLHILLCFLFSKGFITAFFVTMWDHTDVCVKQYHCPSGVYLLSCLSLEFGNFFGRSVGETDHVKDFVGGINFRDKWMPKLKMANLLNP